MVVQEKGMEIPQEGQKYVTKTRRREAAGAHEIVNEFMKHGADRMITMMVIRYNWIWGNECRPKRWTKKVAINLF